MTVSITSGLGVKLEFGMHGPAKREKGDYGRNMSGQPRILTLDKKKKKA